MSPEEIAIAAEKRLAEIEAEAVRLRAVIAAGRGVAPAPVIPTIVPMPYPAPYVPTTPTDFLVITCNNSVGPTWPIPHGTTITGGASWHSGTAGNRSQVYRS